MSIVRHAAYFLQPVVAFFAIRVEALQTVPATFTVAHEGLGFLVSQTFMVRHECAEPTATAAYKPGFASGRVAPELVGTGSSRGDM